LMTCSLHTSVLYCISANIRRTMLITTIIHPVDEWDGQKGEKGKIYIITDRENLSQIKSGKGGNEKKEGTGHRMNEGASAQCEYALALIRKRTNESAG
jgi:hypothetical protein